MPISEPPDPFEIIGEIPEGRAYQWVALTVLGQPQDMADWIISAGAWEFVPPDRHPEMPAKGDRIEYGGCVLVERDAALVEKALAADRERARDRLKPLREKIGILVAPINNPQPVEDATEPVTVEVTIPLRLSPNLVTAASVCGITPEEYARRAVIQMRRGDLNYMFLPTEDTQAFELFDRLIVTRPDRGNIHGR